MNGVCALIKGTPGNNLDLFLPQEDIERRRPSATQKGLSPEFDHTGTLILGFHPP